MIKSYLKTFAYFVFFVMLQVMVLDNIQLFKFVIPLLYVYVIVKLPIHLTRISVILISFTLGLVIDLFFNTLGLHAAACTLTGFFREPILTSLSERDLPEGATPSYHTLGTGAFIRYSFFLVVIHHTALFLIESVSLFDPLFLALRIVGSVILTSLCIFVVEAFKIERKNGDS